jgi:hypothetical protein
MISGIPPFGGMDNLLIIILIINLIIFIRRKDKINNSFVNYVIFFFGLSLFQIITFPEASLYTYVGLLLRIIIAYLSVKNIEGFPHKFIRIMRFFTLIALILYSFFLVFPSIEDYLLKYRYFLSNFEIVDLNKTLFFYTIHREPYGEILKRNAGPFWEPGAFAGYLIVAILFVVLEERKLFTKTSYLFMIGLISTFSTTGYIVFGILTGLYFFWIKNKLKYSFLLLPLFYIFWYLNTTVNFLGAKISNQISNTSFNNYSSDNRFNSALLDIKDIHSNPLIGRGPSNEVRYNNSNETLFFRTNGDTDFLVKFGITGFLFYFFHIYKSIVKISSSENNRVRRKDGFLFLLILFLIGFSETYFYLPFFWALSFLYTNMTTFSNDIHHNSRIQPA